MDVVVGHFGLLEYKTASEFSFPFPRETVSLARAVVNRARREPNAPKIHSRMVATTQSGGPVEDIVDIPYPLPDVSLAKFRSISLFYVLTPLFSIVHPVRKCGLYVGGLDDFQASPLWNDFRGP